MVHDYKKREAKPACFDYGYLTHISEIKNNLGIDTSIVPNTSGYNMQKYEDRHQIWTHALAICGLDKVTFNLRSSRLRPDVPTLFGTPILNVFVYIQKLPNVTGDDIIPTLDSHLAQAPM